MSSFEIPSFPQGLDETDILPGDVLLSSINGSTIVVDHVADERDPVSMFGAIAFFEHDDVKKENIMYTQPRWYSLVHRPIN